MHTSSSTTAAPRRRPLARRLALVGALLAGAGARADPTPPETLAELTAPADGAPAAAAPDAATPAPLDLRVATIRTIRGLLDGVLPEHGTVEDLFTVDVLSEVAVAARREALQRQLDALRASPEADPIEIELAEVRLQWLSLPPPERARLADAHAEGRRIAGERAAADAAHTAAAAEAAAARAAQEEALERARLAADALERDTASEVARGQRLLEEVADHRGALARRREADGALRARLVETAFRLGTQDPAPEDAVALLEEAERTAVEARVALEEALARLDRVGVRVRFTPDPLLLARPDLDAASRDWLQELAARVAAESDKLVAEARAADVAHVRALADVENRLHGTRMALLGRVPDADRDARFGLTNAGLAQVVEELAHVRARFRWGVVHAVLAWRDPLGEIHDIAQVRDLVATTLELLLVGVAGLVGARGVAPTAAWVRRRGDVDVSPPVASALRTAADGVARFGGDAVRLAAVITAGAVVGPWLDWPLVALLYGAAWAWAVYRLASSVIGALLPSRGGDGRALLRTARRFLVLALGSLVLLRAAEATTGAGAVFGVARAGARGLAATLVLVELFRWRHGIADAYLDAWPEGRLAPAVRASRDRWYGAAVAAAAFLLVASQAAVDAARRFALRFDRARRVLAFVLRRSARSSAVAAPVEALPEPLARAFAVDAEAPLVGRKRTLGRVSAHVEAWRGGAPAAVLLTALPGGGRTRVLDELCRQLAREDVHRLAPPRRMPRAADALPWLAEALGVAADDPEALAAALAAGPRRVVVLDRAERLLLRGVAGADAWEALTRVVAASGPSVLWLVGCSALPARYARWRAGPAWPFGDEVGLRPLTEEEVTELLEARLRLAGRRLAEPPPGDVTAIPAEHVLRLAWDQTDGNPAAALDVLRRALRPVGKTHVRLGLCAEPDVADLDDLDEAGAFVLAGVAWHDGIETPELVTSLRLPAATVAAVIGRLAAAGVLTREVGWRVATAWVPPVHRYLLRKHLSHPP